jgi:4-oxalmesaconate hydratase
VGADRCLFGTERPGTGTSLDPKTGRWMDDIKPLIEDIEWLTAGDRKRIFEDNARELYHLDAAGVPR